MKINEFLVKLNFFAKSSIEDVKNLLFDVQVFIFFFSIHLKTISSQFLKLWIPVHLNYRWHSLFIFRVVPLVSGLRINSLHRIAHCLIELFFSTLVETRLIEEDRDNILHNTEIILRLEIIYFIIQR